MTRRAGNLEPAERRSVGAPLDPVPDVSIARRAARRSPGHVAAWLAVQDDICHLKPSRRAHGDAAVNLWDHGFLLALLGDAPGPDGDRPWPDVSRWEFDGFITGEKYMAGLQRR